MKWERKRERGEKTTKTQSRSWLVTDDEIPLVCQWEDCGAGSASLQWQVPEIGSRDRGACQEWRDVSANGLVQWDGSPDSFSFDLGLIFYPDLLTSSLFLPAKGCRNPRPVATCSRMSGTGLQVPDSRRPRMTVGDFWIFLPHPRGMKSLWKKYRALWRFDKQEFHCIIIRISYG